MSPEDAGGLAAAGPPRVAVAAIGGAPLAVVGGVETRSGLTARGLVVSALVAAAIGGALPYVILTLGFAPNVSLLATFLGYLLLRSRGRGGSRLELHAAHVAGVAAGQSAFACVALAALDLLHRAGAIESAPPAASVLAGWLASAGCLGVVLAMFARRHFIDDERLPFAGGAVAAEAILVLDPARDGPDRRPAHVSLVVALGVSAALGSLGLTRGALAAGGSGMLLGSRVALSIGAGSALAVVARASFAGGDTGRFARATPWFAMAMLVAAACTMLAASLPGHVRASRTSASSAPPRPAADRALGRATCVAACAALLVVCAMGYRLVGFPIRLTLASVALSLPLLFVGTRVLGETNWAPSSTLTAVAQAALAAIVPGCLVGNMLGSAIAGAIPAGGAHMMQSLRAAQIVGATARDTAIVQILGAVVGALGVGAVYPRLVARYGFGSGGLVSPLSVSAASIGELLVHGAGSLPPDGVVALAAGALTGIALVAFERRIAAIGPAPLPLAIGLMLPFASGGSMAVGGAIAWAWRRFHRASDETHRTSVASGAIAGDAIAAVSAAFRG